MFINPYGNRVLAEIEKESNKTESGIIIVPDQPNQRSSNGIIKRVGSESKLNVGDRIMFSKFAAHEVEFNRDTFFIVEDKHIIGTYTQEIN